MISYGLNKSLDGLKLILFLNFSKCEFMCKIHDQGRIFKQSLTKTHMLLASYKVYIPGQSNKM